METIVLCEKCGEGEYQYNLHPHKDKRTVKVCQSCFDKSYWAEYIGAAVSGDVLEDGRMVVRCEGQHYVIGDENVPYGLNRGHGGAKFTFTFTAGPHKGKTITSTNVWSQSGIPAEYREFLPDNAVRIQEDFSSITEGMRNYALRSHK